MKLGYIIKNQPILGTVLFLLGLIFFGGFFEWTAALLVSLVSVGIIIFWAREKKTRNLPSKLIFYAPFLFMACGLVSTFTAVDKSLNVIGFFYMGVAVLWYFLCFEMGNDRNEAVIDSVPLWGSILTVVGLLGYLADPIYEFLFIADRYGGIFQYPNTCALFMALGIVITVNEFSREKLVKDIIYLVLLTVGLLMTASRSVELLLVLWVLYTAITRKKLRKPVLIGLGAVVVIVFIAFCVTGLNSNFTRILTLFSSSSTVWGRLLYDVDGVKILFKHPLGLGYLGYFFSQGLYQTGVYSVRFAHNDLLQSGLDYGIGALAIMGITVIYHLFKGNVRRVNKEVLTMAFLASLVDFHMQFPVIVMLMISCLDFDYKTTAVSIKKKRENFALAGLVALAGLYFLIPFYRYYNREPERALNWWNSYTEAQLDILCSEDIDIYSACELAGEICQRNDCVVAALQALAMEAGAAGDYAEAVECYDRAISLRPYDVELYGEYDSFLISLMDEAAARKDLEGYGLLSDRYNSLPDTLRLKEETTSPLAYKIIDVPVFEYK